MKKFDKDKYLKKLKLKRKWRSYSRYVYIAVPCVLCCLLCLYFAYSKFFVSKEQAVIRTTVGDFIYGDVVINAYIDGEYSSTIPGKNDGYVVDKVSCDNGAVGEWNNDDWGLLTTNLTKRTKCNVYFHKDYLAPIIAQLDSTGKCPTMNADGSVNVTGVETTNGYLCKAPDAYGDSYYYRGNVTNNYVKFGEWQVRKYFGYYSDTSNDYQMYDSLEECQNASYYNKKCAMGIDIGTPMYWRIVRINGDGTVRVIYDGTSAHANGESSSDRQIGPSAFNSGDKDNAYVGYMYGKIGASTYTAAHANTNDSIIKTYLDNWYKTNISGTSNEQYLADNIFCNDRSLASGTGFGQSSAYYRGQSLYGSVKNVTLSCSQKNDAFTVNDIINGNGALTYGIGLITADEVILAKDNYLNSGYDFWTMTPSDYNDDVNLAYILIDRNFNGIYITAKSSAWSFVWQAPLEDSVVVRPVLNLKPEVLKHGAGTASNPYRLTKSLDNSSSSESGGIDTGD